MPATPVATDSYYKQLNSFSGHFKLSGFYVQVSPNVRHHGHALPLHFGGLTPAKVEIIKAELHYMLELGIIPSYLVFKKLIDDR